MCGKSRKHSFNTEVIVDSSISRAWTPHAIFLSDRNDPLWECWYNLSNLTNQRVYQELVYRNGSFKEMITGSAAPALPSFLLFYFRVWAFSILSQCISRGLQQARNVVKTWCLILQVVKKKIGKTKAKRVLDNLKMPKLPENFTTADRVSSLRETGWYAKYFRHYSVLSKLRRWKTFRRNFLQVR